MAPTFCCSQLRPFKPTRTDHEAKFEALLAWGKGADTDLQSDDDDITKLLGSSPSFVVQIVRQVNYGPLEFKRCFTEGVGENAYVELTEKALITANFEKLNS
jgi:hypothetical protein